MSSQTKVPAPAIIHKLVETFEQNLESYRSSKNETELRREFLDKFFAALGWDVANEKGYDEAHKEVVHEFSVETAEGGKKADYAFRTGARFEFLVEAKKPSVKIESSQDAAFQIRRYGWSAKLPINILTDFEHFAVYDCRAKPKYGDAASVGRIMLIHYKEYAERWDEIASVFSPEAIRKGSLAKYAEGMKGKKGAADVDDAFLQEIERWREALAKNIALRNPEIDIAGLNYAVQMTIDRIVFLRICEERGIEPENQLLDIATPLVPPIFAERGKTSQTLNGENGGMSEGQGGREGVYAQLCELFQRADTKYNSGLFHFKKEKEQASRPDDLTLDLKIDDKVLKDVISNLYYPKSPYAFLYIPADILGQVYERFLGKVIRLTAGHQAKVEEKPEVRKAGGVYYTPTYIVEYIVKNTVGRILNSSTPKEAAALKILDPACGSGTFLLGAYQFLLDWHLNWYVANDPEKWVKQKALAPSTPSVPAGHLPHFPQENGGGRVGGSYRLTTAKKKEILLNNIFGVDIDPQAVEVTKLSLLLKALEDASGQLTLGMERVLPDLGGNIKCGNSLIGWDYFEGQLFPDEAERARVNPFDWEREFPQVFDPRRRSATPPPNPKDLGEAGRGFDAVIGNPPYVLLQTLDQPKVFKYLKKKYKSATYKIDTYAVFIERGLSLLKPSGKFSYITPNTFLKNKFAIELRKIILELSNVNILRVFSYRVFDSASVDTSIIVLTKSNNPNSDNLVQIIKSTSIDNEISATQKQQVWNEHFAKFFILPSSPEANLIMSKIDKKSIRLGEFATAYFGIQTFDRSTYVKSTQSKKFMPVIDGANIFRYQLVVGKEYVQFTPQAIKSGGNQNVYIQKRIGVRQIGETPIATILPPHLYTLNTIYNIYFIKPTGYSLEFVLSVIVSKALGWYWKQNFFDEKQTFPKIKKEALLSIPIPVINFSDPADKAAHDKMVSLVEQMLALHKEVGRIGNPPHVQERLERQIEVADRAIDALVYELYGLTEEEIKIVEGNAHD